MTTPRAWPDHLKETWAKSAEKGAGGQPETLADHTWSVLEKLAATIRLRPALPEQIGVPRLWHVLFWAAFLHDFGKAARGFQARLRGGEKWPHRHEVLSLAFVDWITSAFSDDEQRWLVAAIVSHHRDAAEIRQLYNTVGDPDDQTLHDLMAEVDIPTLSGLWRWLAECPPSWIEELGLAEAGIALPDVPAQELAVRGAHEQGAARIRHWLTQYQRWLDKTVNRSAESALLTGTILLRGHLISSDHMASAHVGELPKPQLAEPKTLIKKLKLPDLYDHQRDCLTVRGSAVLMAPTGSGKTEAALLWAASQAEPDRPVPRLYYTLPFQASMNAMERRLNEDDEDSQRQAPFKGQVGLEHSRSTLAYYRRLLVENENADPQKVTQAAKWLKNLAQLNYYPVRVLSPYQLLKAPYRLKGYETLLTDCYGAAFIFDEVHAYEAGRLAKILALVKHLRENYRARFFMMSATLPKLLREQLAEALGDYRLLQASNDLYAQFRRHMLILKDGDLLAEANLDNIAEAARSGQLVLVCCNTVLRAQEARQKLIERLPGNEVVELLHSRFNGKDRLHKEEIVRAATGSRSVKRRAIVLVATQVVEVSLDIDLDMIYTDPAPLEALLQRFGRVNRQHLKESAPVCVFRGPVPDKPRPYEPELIKAALAVLERHDGKLIDEAQVSNWLDEVYARPEISEPWVQTYQREYTEFCESALAELRAFQSDDKLEEAFYSAFESVDVLPENLYEKYLKARDESPLDASQFLVPLQWRQYGRLLGQGRAYSDEEGKLKLVRAYYDEETGLDLSRDSREVLEDW